MVCKVCEKKPYFNKMCMQCFNNYFIKKVRRRIRLNDLFRRNDSVFVKDKKDAQSFAAKWILEHMEMPLIFSKKGKEILGSSAEEESSEFLKSMFENKILKKDKKIRLFTQMNVDEIYAFAKLKGYKGKNPELDELMRMAEAIEKKHSTTKSALFKSVQALKQL